MKQTNKPYIIAFDMDGTLLNDKKKICFRTLHYLRKLSRQGHKIVLASGRPSRALWQYYNKLHLKTPMICYNGAYLFSPHDKNFKPIEFQFPRNIIINCVEDLKEFILNVMCETETEIWVDKPDRYLAKFFWYQNMEIHVGELKDTLKKDPMTCIIQTPVEYTNTSKIDQIVEKYPGIGARFWTGSPYFELYYKTTSKGASLEKVEKYYNIPNERVIAFGDAENDVEMLSHAGISIAMKNGKESLKKYAKIVTSKDNNHNGIYDTLKKIIN